MGALVSYQVRDSVATITMDDGKVNVLSAQMLAELGAALDRAEADRAVVVLAGRPGVFSAGFDLAVLRSGGAASAAMVRAGFGMAIRLLAFPAPVLIACTGHAIAMGSFLLLSGDYRLGAGGRCKITLNEVAMGIPLPQVAIEICRQRLTAAHFTRAVMLAEVFGPGDAMAAGFLDRVVPAAELAGTASATAADLARLDRGAHVTTKLRAREPALTAIRSAFAAENLLLPAPA